MSHKYEHVSTGGGFKVKNGSTIKTVINQDGSLADSITIADDIVETAKIKDGNVTSAKMDEKTIQYAEVAISSADITATTAGKLGHADGYPLVAAPGASKALEFISAVVIYDYATKAYTDGGTVTVNYAGGSAVTGTISAANSFGASGDKVYGLKPLSTAGVNMPVNTGLNLVASAAFTQPDTAAGVGRIKIAYRVHTHGL